MSETEWLQSSEPEPGEAAGTERYRHFARLAADWFWELDAELRYTHHEGRPSPFKVGEFASYIGIDRPSQLLIEIGPSAELDEHVRGLRAHERVDSILSFEMPDRSRHYVHVVAEPLFERQGAFLGYHGCGRDVTLRMRMREQLEHCAMHDELTCLCNRREFKQRLDAVHAIPADDTAHSLCLIDLDRFKLVNDSAGHAAGDQLLKRLSEVMGRDLRPGETLARLGGDEFALLLHSAPNLARVRAERLIAAVSNHDFVWEDRHYTVGASVGIAAICARAGSVSEILDRADRACYVAKDEGRNRCVVFEPDSAAWLRHRDEIRQIEIIKEALRANRLRLFMQAIKPAEGAGESAEHEILLRLETADGELLQPATFIPVAERFGIMQELDQWVLQHCLETLEAFETSGEPVSLSVNLSGNTLSDRGCLERIVETLLGAEIDLRMLCLEITETAAINNIDAVVDFMHTLKAEGVKFALDDFGTGLSSFAYIRLLPIDFLKIDGYFIRNIRSDATNRAITSAFIQLSRELGIATVAESVEDKATWRAVAAMGIDYVQGFGVAQPLDVDMALAAVSRRSVRKVVNG